MMPYHFTLFTSLYGPQHDDSNDCYVSNAFHSRVDALASRPPFIIGHYQTSKLRTRYNALVKLQQFSKYHSRLPRHHVSRSHSKSQYSSRPSRNARISIDPAPTPQAHTNQTSSQSSGQGSSSSSGEGSASEYLPHFVRRQPRIQVSSLLSDTYARTYQLEVIQHPQKTAEFRNASLSRLPLTPPLIARLVVRDTSGNAVVPEAELPFLIAHLSLYTDNGQSRLDVGWQSGQGPPILYGNLVSSLDVLEDLQGNMGLFFIFPDVSIRWQGRFQLGISLLRISSPCSTDAEGRVSVADTGTILAETRTRSFEVLPQDQYQAVPHTRLTQSFIRQGARMFSFLPQQ